MNSRVWAGLLVLPLLAALTAPAQNFSGDARKIGMGGIGYSENIATRMVEEQRPYSSVVIPLGFIQMALDRKHFDPDDDTFDPILERAAAYTETLDAKLSQEAVNGITLGTLVLVVRIVLEDRTLQEELADYKEYAARVRYRLIPGVW